VIRTPNTTKTLHDLNTAAELQIRAELQRASQDPTTQDQEEDDSVPPTAAGDAIADADSSGDALKARVGPSKRHRRFRERRKAWRQKHRERNAGFSQESAAAAAVEIPV
jgi:hypothetical protein